MGYHLHNQATVACRAAAGDDWFARPENYLHVPFAAAGSLKRALLQLDMAYDVSDYGYQTPNTWTGTSGRPPFTFPDPAGYELTSYQDPDGMIIWDGPRLTEFQAERAQQHVLALHLPREQPGIPIRKLGTPRDGSSTGASAPPP